MGHHLTVALEESQSKQELVYKPGEILRGTIQFSSDKEVYLDSVNALLLWTTIPKNGKEISILMGEEAEIEDSLLIFGKTRKPIQRRRDIDDLEPNSRIRKIIDQRRISKDINPDFESNLSPGVQYIWRFTFNLPNAPWSYSGGLFMVQWAIETNLKIGRIRIPLFGPKPQKTVTFRLSPI